VTLKASDNAFKFANDGDLRPVSKWEIAEGNKPVLAARSD